MRTRVFKDTSELGGLRDYWKYNSGTYAFDRTYSWTKRAWYETMQDVVTANFHARMRNGEIILNPKARYSWYISEEAGRCWAKGNNEEADLCFEINQFLGLTGAPPAFTAFGSFTALHDAIEATYANNIDKAVTQSWANIDVSEAAALASLGELPETIGWLVSLVTRAIRLFRLFKSKEKRVRAMKNLTKKQIADSLSDLWLEFRYAVRPLIFEAKQCVEALQAEIKRGSRQTARGWDMLNESETSYSTHTFIGLWNIPVQWKVSSLVNFRAGVLYDIDSDINGIMALWGLDQSMEAIWELTPFSFIVDWFLNIGDIISSWSISPHLHPLGSWVTVESVSSVEGILSGSPTDAGHYLNAVEGPIVTNEGSYKHESRFSVRYINPTRTITPRLNLNLDVAKLTDLATIARSILRS